MSIKTDLFIEKIVVRMNLDDAQRIDVEREFRAHLDEAIEAGTATGLSPAIAENEALAAFGQPSVLARQFGLLHGTAWLAFEWVAMAVTIYLILLLSSWSGTRGRFEVVASHLFCALLSLIFVYRIAWGRIVVNGVLQIYRPFRRTVSLPLSAIREIRLEKGHLWGRRNLVITHDGGKITFSSKLRNMRCVAQALNALVPHAVAPEVREYFRRVITKVRKEGVAFKWGLSVLWGVVTACFLIAFPALWEVRGFSPWLIGGFAGGILGSIMQIIFHADRSKRGIAWLNLGGLLLALTMFGNLVAGYPQVLRWLSLTLLALGIYPIAVIWWRSVRSYLLLIYLALAVIVVGVLPRLVAERDTTVTLGVHRYLPESAVWLTRPESIYVSLGWVPEFQEGAPTNALLGLDNRTTSTQFALGPGQWRLVPNYSDDTLTLARTADPRSKVPRTDFFLYKYGGKLTPLDSCLARNYCIVQGAVFWSLKKTFYILPEQSKENPTNLPADLRIVRAGDRQSVSLPNMFTFFTWWLDDTTLRILLPSGTSRNEKQPSQYEIWAVDAATGQKRLEHSVDFGDLAPTHQYSSCYVFLCKKNEIQATGRLDLRTGKVDRLRAAIDILSVNKQSEEFAYLESLTDHNRLVVESSAGIVYRRDLRHGEKINQVVFSNDQRKMLFSYQNGSGVIGDGLTSYLIYDFASRNTKLCQRLNLLQSIIEDIARLPSHAFYIQWSPNDRAVVFPVPTWQLESGKIIMASELRLAEAN